MDRNQATGLILIALMVLIYFQFFAPEPKPVEEEPTQVETTIKEEPAQPTEIIDIPVDSVQDELLKQKFGVFAVGGQGEENKNMIEGEDITVTFSNKGGRVDQVVLNKFKDNNMGPLILFDENSNEFKLNITSLGRTIDLNSLYYTPSKKVENDTTIISFTLALSPNQYVRHTYRVPNQGYEIGYNLEFKGLDEYISKEDVILNWKDNMKAQEKDVQMSRRNSTINYYTVNEDFDGLSEGSTGLEEEVVDEKIKWVSLKQRFFVSAMIADNSFNKAKITTKIPENDPRTVKNAEVVLSLPYEDLKSGNGKYRFYFGPNDYHVLTEVTDEFSRNLYLGWPPMSWVNRFVIIPLFDLLNNFLGNYGLIIIIMVLIIKLVLSPLSYKSYLSMAKMKVLKPELDEIKEKHGDDMAKAQQEQMKLYQKVGVNPVSGCIPMLLQMPILLAMFYFFPQSIELRQEGFLWADDLSTFDVLFSWDAHIPLVSDFYGNHVSLFVLLMTASTILYTWSQQQVSTVQGPMKVFSYMMPVIFMFVLNSYPAALSFYYFISNLVTFGQQALIRKFVDEDKIRTILEENKKRNLNKKKSKFQIKLEEAMKAQKNK